MQCWINHLYFLGKILVNVISKSSGQALKVEKEIKKETKRRGREVKAEKWWRKFDFALMISYKAFKLIVKKDKG